MRIGDSSRADLSPLPARTHEFFGLAAVEIRRELLDLARRCGAAKRRGAVPLEEGQEPVDDHDSTADLDRCAAFHEAVTQLPEEERQVMGLRFSCALTHEQVAELMGISIPTVADRWLRACHRLNHMLNGTLPRG